MTNFKIRKYKNTVTEAELYEALNYVNHSREKRSYYAQMILNNLELVAPLLNILFTVDDKVSCRAAWVFEYACSADISISHRHLDYFTENINRVHLDPAVRPVAKVCELLIANHYKAKAVTPNVLSLDHRERITEACFDWMISDQKVAVKAYSMSTLYQLGREFDWIHPELLIILERDFAKESAAFKARARHIIKRLKSKR
ncbi:adenylosuccinate lyase [Winogradskyella maritima]|uniref:Adenylosuccinate lyase n=1 Tax=Winogradskyella maritima TaxID=1517766 RepID=A0ABV8AIE8_9FLAO|nr:adenylosuccinate lyase [Winogradskyella maritima]